MYLIGMYFKEMSVITSICEPDIPSIVPKLAVEVILPPAEQVKLLLGKREISRKKRRN